MSETNTDVTGSALAVLSELNDAVELAKQTQITASTSTELVLGRDDAIQTKTRLASAHSEIARTTKAAHELRERARGEIEDLRRALSNKIAELDAQMKPVEKALARIQDGIGAVNLYLGRDEHIEELRDGASAAVGSVLHIRQQVLAMDEESALFAESGGIDFTEIHRFTDWLLESEANLSQVVPDELCVVAIMPRRTPMHYTDNAMANSAMNAQNFQSWWLIRNGQRLYLMTTDFSVGERLIPERNEFTDMFVKRDFDGQRRPMEPGSREWLAAEESADARTRHYMKVALILQGLVDRTAVFHPLPEGGLNLLSESSYENGQVVLLADDELAIGMGRPSFADFQRERLSKLDVGMRVVGYFNDSDSIHPAHASYPDALVPHTITRGDARSLFFAYDRTDTVWRSDFTSGPSKTRASYQLDRKEHKPSYVSIDNITVEEIEYYLGSRSERHAYKHMFPALKAAAAFIRDEENAEQPFRDLLAAALISESLATESDATAVVRELITWWKTANKWHRALNGDAAHELKAQTGILREARRRRDTASDPSILKAVRTRVPNAMVIASRTSDVIAVEPIERRFPHAAAPGNIWVRIHEFTARGRFRKVSDWRSLTRAQVAKWTIWEQSDQWNDWQFNVDSKTHLTDDAIEAVLQQVRDFNTDTGIAALKYYEDVLNSEIFVTAYLESRIESSATSSPAFEQDYRMFRVSVEAGVGRVSADGANHYSPSHSWSLSSPFVDEEVSGEGYNGRAWQSPHLTNYSGAQGRDNIVWVDETVLTRDRILLKEFAEQYRISSAASDRRGTLYREIRAAWDVAEEKSRFDRFMEDFADESLWADHKKPEQFPVKSSGWNRGDALNGLIRQLTDGGHATEGMSVAEAVAATGYDRGLLPEAIMGLRFAS